MFDFIDYFRRVTAENKKAQADGFVFATCSGTGYLEEVLQQFRRAAHFVCVNDTAQGTFFERGGGFFQRRVVTIQFLSRFAHGNMDDYHAALERTRELCRQFVSRLIADAEVLRSELIFINTSDIRLNDLGGEFVNGATGRVMMFSIDEPTSLCYNKDEWN